MGNAAAATPPPEPPPADIPVKKVVKEPPKRIFTEPENDDLAIPELHLEEENPRLILLTALLRIGKATDPNYSEKELYKYFKVNEKKIVTKQLPRGQLLFRKGQKPDGIYVVQEGEVGIFASTKKDEVMRVFKKDFIFDVEVIYEMNSMYTMKTLTDCTVNFVATELVDELIKEMQRPHIQHWYIRRRLPPNHPKLTPKVVYNKICISVLKQVPLFADWEEDTIQAFIEYMGKTPMVLYRTKTPIIQQGDPGGDMVILVRGRVHAYERKNKLVTYFVQKVPFAFGEEGVFNDNWNHKISVIADSPCYAITINKTWLWHAAEFVWKFAEGAEPHWTEAVQKWWTVLDTRNLELTENSIYAPYLSIEIIYQWLKCTPSFKNCAFRYVYELAKCGTAVLIEGDSFFNYSNLEEGCLLVLKGQLELVTVDQLNGIKKMRKKKPPVEGEPGYVEYLKKQKLKEKERRRMLKEKARAEKEKNAKNEIDTPEEKYDTGENGEKEMEDEDEWEEVPPALYNAQDLVYYKDASEELYLKSNTECLLVKFPVEDILNEMPRVHVETQPIDFLPSLIRRKSNAGMGKL